MNGLYQSIGVGLMHIFIDQVQRKAYSNIAILPTTVLTFMFSVQPKSRGAADGSKEEGLFFVFLFCHLLVIKISESQIWGKIQERQS